ncbi:integrase core domain protein [Escherichia coli p0305293.7]|nr:integrase core domain protein [Escherichia coli p0305293.7]
MPEPEVAGDITYLRTDEGWLYLAVVIDLWSRAVIGWSMSPRMTAQLACDALQMALGGVRGPGTLSFTRTVEASTVQQIIRRN